MVIEKLIYIDIYTPYTIYYSRNKDEWIDRAPYEEWLKETIKQEREVNKGKIFFTQKKKI